MMIVAFQQFVSGGFDYDDVVVYYTAPSGEILMTTIEDGGDMRGPMHCTIQDMTDLFMHLFNDPTVDIIEVRN